jgi:hypothetical protein
MQSTLRFEAYDVFFGIAEVAVPYLVPDASGW